jgi:hypothetical protein
VSGQDVMLGSLSVYFRPSNAFINLYPPFEGSLLWFESKLNLSRLEEAGCETSAALVWNSRCFFSLWGLWLVFGSYWVVALKDAVPAEGREQ